MSLVVDDPHGRLLRRPRLYPPAGRSSEDENPEICEDNQRLGFSLRNLSMSWWLSPLVQRGDRPPSSATRATRSWSPTS